MKKVIVLVIPIALGLLSFLYVKANMLPAATIGLISAIDLASIDFYYTLNNTICNIYMADGVLQVLFIICWVIVFTQARPKLSK